MHARTLVSMAAAVVVLLAPAARAGEPPKKTPQLVEKGKASFALNCAACHGAKGEGDGAAAAALNPKPRNFAKIRSSTGRAWRRSTRRSVPAARARP